MTEEEEQFRILRMLRDNPVKFAEYVLDVKPFPYQEKFLLDSSRRIVVCSGRQIGKTLMTSVRALWFAVTQENTNTLIVSATMRQSMFLFDKILILIDSSPLVAKAVRYRSRTKIQFTNNSMINALPCGTAGKTLRGPTSNQIIIDEAAFVPEQVIAAVLLPMLATTNGNVIMLSTPFDRDHIFYKSFTSPLWSKYHFPSSINPLITKEFLEEMLGLVGQEVFNREYMGEFVDDSKAFFSLALLRSNVHYCEEDPCEYCDILESPETKLGPQRKLYGGYDPGGKLDPGAFVVVERLKDQSLRVVFTKTYLADPKRKEENLYTDFTLQISEYCKKFALSKLLVDSTGLGSPIVENCKELKLPAEGLQLTVSSKQEILSNIRLLLENKRLRLSNDMSLLSNLSCVIREESAAGHFIFSHPRGTHDDLAYALSLACFAAKKPSAYAIMNKDSEGVNWRDAYSGLS